MSHSNTIAGMEESNILEILYRGVGEKRLSHPDVTIGVGDDAALLRANSGSYVVSTDTMIQNYDFMLTWPNGTEQPANSIGYKAIAQNVSDLNAMGAHTTGVFISLSLPPSTPVEWLEDFGRGINAALDELGADHATVAGGDLGQGGKVVITVMVTGELESQPLLRRNARVGDHIYVCGRLGEAAAGLETLLAAATTADVATAATQFYPQPPLHAGPLAARYGARCGMDVSDGLMMDLGRILKASGPHLQAELEVPALSVFVEPLASAATRHSTNPWNWIFSGGEDYALLVTAPQHITLPEEFIRIGEITVGTDSSHRVSLRGEESEHFEAASRAATQADKGWDHFR